MGIKLIALDLDGTTLNSTGALTQATREAIENAILKKVHVVIATGRAHSALPEEILDVKGIRYLLTSNGARVFDLKASKTIYTNLIEQDAIEKTVDLLKQHDFMIEAFVSGNAYMDRKIYEDIGKIGLNKKHTDYVLKTRKPVDNLLDFILLNKELIENININFGRQEEKQMMAELLKELEKVTITSSFDHNLEIGGETTSKADAIRNLCITLEIEEEEIMACGDSPNDLSMLISSGFPVAMGNSKDKLKEIAKFITGSNDEDGVAFAINKFVL